MKFIYFPQIPSTQKYLLNHLEKNVCIWSEYQTDGIGSRGNSWIGEMGNLFFSFSVDKRDDLPMQYISIYYMYQLKIVLNMLGSKVKFKWPNDLYLKNKVAGIITNIKNDIIIVGIGINTKQSKNFESLDIQVDNKTLLNNYFEYLSLHKSWKEIFDKYKTEFYQSKFVTSNNLDLSKAKLNDDGSIEINNERIYSLR
jgi:BirA family biotin operon repressor/biotin-[acetyl-CoA-carboxylase] ligase